MENSWHQRPNEDPRDGSINLSEEARHLFWRLHGIPVSRALDVSASVATKVKPEAQAP